MDLIAKQTDCAIAHGAENRALLMGVLYSTAVHDWIKV